MLESKAQEAIDHVADSIGIDSHIVPQVSGVLKSAREEASDVSINDLRNISVKELKSTTKETIAEAKGSLKDFAAEQIEENKEKL